MNVQMQSYAIKTQKCTSYFIFLYIFTHYTHITFPHQVTTPSTTPTNAKIPAQRFLRISEPGISCIYI